MCSSTYDRYGWVCVCLCAVFGIQTAGILRMPQCAMRTLATKEEGETLSSEQLQLTREHAAASVLIVWWKRRKVAMRRRAESRAARADIISTQSSGTLQRSRAASASQGPTAAPQPECVPGSAPPVPKPPLPVSLHVPPVAAFVVPVRGGAGTQPPRVATRIRMAAPPVPADRMEDVETGLATFPTDSFNPLIRRRSSGRVIHVS
jgi:hypothetical protein